MARTSSKKTSPRGNGRRARQNGGGAEEVDVRAVRARFPALSRRIDNHPLVYLDAAATSQRPAEVLEAMDERYRHDNGNSHQREELLEAMTPAQFGGGTAETVTLRRHRFMSHPESFEAGTGNPAASVGFRAAIELMNELGREAIWRYEQRLTAYGLERLGAVKGLELLGARDAAWERVPTFAFTFKDRDGEEVARALGRRGIAVSGGKLHAQPLLKRYGLEGAVRASCWVYNTTQEIDRLAEALEPRSGWTAHAVDRAANAVEKIMA